MSRNYKRCIEAYELKVNDIETYYNFTIPFRKKFLEVLTEDY